MANGSGNFFLGAPSQTKQLSVLSPEQLNAQRSTLGSAQNVLQNSPLSFAPQREQYVKQFNEQVIPTLAERFSGNLSSSAFKGALGNTTSDFYSKLAGLESQYNLGARQQGLRELQQGLQPEFQNLFQPRQQGFLENILANLAQGAGQAGVSYLTGGSSAAGQAGNTANDFFSWLKGLFNGGGQAGEAQPTSFQSQFQPSQGNVVGGQQLMNLYSQIFEGR